MFSALTVHVVDALEVEVVDGDVVDGEVVDVEVVDGEVVDDEVLVDDVLDVVFTDLESDFNFRNYLKPKIVCASVRAAGINSKIPVIEKKGREEAVDKLLNKSQCEYHGFEGK